MTAHGGLGYSSGGALWLCTPFSLVNPSLREWRWVKRDKTRGGQTWDPGDYRTKDRGWLPRSQDSTAHARKGRKSLCPVTPPIGPVGWSLHRESQLLSIDLVAWQEVCVRPTGSGHPSLRREQDPAPFVSFLPMNTPLPPLVGQVFSF